MRLFIFTILLCLFQMAHADCISDIARQNSLDPMDLKAIVRVESKGDPKAVHHDRNGSTSYGLMQINSIHLPELRKQKVFAKDLFNSCKNVRFGATLLRRNLDRYKSMDRAIAMYNPGDPRYLGKVRTARAQLRREQMLDNFSKGLPIEVASN
jgi:soluble lytic murein transglycosylase-like protein